MRRDDNYGFVGMTSAGSPDDEYGFADTTITESAGMTSTVRHSFTRHYRPSVIARCSSGPSPFVGFGGGRAKLPLLGGCVRRPTSASAIRTAQLTPSRTGTSIPS